MPPTAKIIKDMPEMSKFVYDFYYKVIERLMKEQSEDDKRREAAESAAHRFKVSTLDITEGVAGLLQSSHDYCKPHHE